MFGLILPKIVVPKLSEDISQAKNIDGFIQDKLEIQLMQTDMSTYPITFRKWVSAYPRIKTYILHIPFLFVSIASINSSRKLREEFDEFVANMIKESFFLNKEIYILFHIDIKTEILEKTGAINYIEHLIRMVENTNVSFLGENSIFTLENRAKDGGPFYQVVKRINSNKLRCCFDICHSTVNQLMFGKDYDLAADIGKYTKSIHFSSTLNNDGWRDKKTHGRAHKNKGTLIADLLFLEEKGFDLENTFLVTEINEEDYNNRPDLLKELTNIKEIKEGIF